MGNIQALKTLYEAREYGQAWQLYLGDEYSDDAEWQLVGAQVAWGMRDLFRARMIIENRCVPLTEEVPSIRVRALISAGVICRELGDTAMATEYLQQGVGHPEASEIMQGYGLYNLALVHYQRRDYEMAESCDAEAMEWFHKHEITDMFRRAAQNRAWALCRTGRANEAGVILDECEELCTSQEARWHQVISRAAVAVGLGRWDDATDYCKRLTDLRVPPDIQGQAAWLAGRVRLAFGDVDGAIALANTAMYWGIEVRDSRLCNDASELKRECISRRQVENGA